MPHVLWISKETPDRHGQGGQRRQFFQIRELHRADVEVSALLARGDQNSDEIRAFARVRQFGGRLPRLRRGASPTDEVRSSRYDAVVIAHGESFEVVEATVGEAPGLRLLDFHNVN